MMVARLTTEKHTRARVRRNGEPTSRAVTVLVQSSTRLPEQQVMQLFLQDCEVKLKLDNQVREGGGGRVGAATLVVASGVG